MADVEPAKQAEIMVSEGDKVVLGNFMKVFKQGEYKATGENCLDLAYAYTKLKEIHDRIGQALELKGLQEAKEKQSKEKRKKSGSKQPG